MAEHTEGLHELERQPHGRVIVGWSEDAYEPSVLEAATIEAGARAASLTVVTDGPDREPSSGEQPHSEGDRILRADLGAITEPIRCWT